MATLSRMTQYGPGAHIVVVWRYAHKPSQHCLLPSDVQPSLFGSQVEIGPPKKLRVWWSKRSNLLTDSFVPYHKSVNEESLIQAVFDAGGDQTGVEYVEIGAIQGECVIEARRVTVGTELCVVSLLHLPQDDNCQGRNKSYGHSVL